MIFLLFSLFIISILSQKCTTNPVKLPYYHFRNILELFEISLIYTPKHSLRLHFEMKILPFRIVQQQENGA